jgi:hypothetical protein
MMIAAPSPLPYRFLSHRSVPRPESLFEGFRESQFHCYLRRFSASFCGRLFELGRAETAPTFSYAVAAWTGRPKWKFTVTFGRFPPFFGQGFWIWWHWSRS